MRGQNRYTEETRTENAAHPHQRDRRVLAFRLPKRGNSIRHCLDSGECDGTGRKCSQQHHQAERFRAFANLSGLRTEQIHGDRTHMLHVDAVKPGSDEEKKHHDVEVRGSGERGPRLLHTTKIHDGHDEDTQKAHRNGPLVIETGCRSDGQYTAGDTHGHGEDVVHQKRRPRHQRGNGPEVLATHDVGPTTGRIRHDRLSIRRDHDRHQRAHDERDRNQRTEGCGSDARLNQEYGEDFIGGVRGR